MFFQLVKQMAERKGMTDRIKASSQMAQAGAMNNIRNRATEIVNTIRRPKRRLLHRNHEKFKYTRLYSSSKRNIL